MSTLVLEVQFIDNVTSIDKEFDSLDAVRTYLNGQRETDYDWLCLHDNNTDMVIEGWSDIHQYINENTGISKSSCIALRASELNLPVIDQPALLELEPEDLKGIPMRVGDSIEFQPLPGAVKFSELEDGAWFCPLSLWAYGSKRAFQKTLEDGGEHNAVYTSFTETGFKFKDDDLVMRLNK